MQNPTDTADRLSAELASVLPCTVLGGLSDELLLQATGAIERLGRLVDGLRVSTHESPFDGLQNVGHCLKSVGSVKYARVDLNQLEQ